LPGKGKPAFAQAAARRAAAGFPPPPGFRRRFALPEQVGGTIWRDKMEDGGIHPFSILSVQNPSARGAIRCERSANKRAKLN